MVLLLPANQKLRIEFLVVDVELVHGVFVDLWPPKFRRGVLLAEKEAAWQLACARLVRFYTQDSRDGVALVCVLTPDFKYRFAHHTVV